MNSDLTKQIQSSIDDTCQCTLPSYTLRGSIDLCDPQSNCAIYTGRILGSDTASATQVFKMVEDWLTIQNGSLLNGALIVDPDCPLRRLSPSDTVCSFSDTVSTTDDNSTEEDSTTEEVDPTENEVTGNRQGVQVIQMLAIGFGSGFGVIICTVIICACVYKLRKMKNKKSDALSYSQSQARLSPFLQTSDDAQRHYSVVIERNPSYHHHRNNAVKRYEMALLNGGQPKVSSSESPYSYTSLKTAQREADAFCSQQEEGIDHLTIEHLHRHPSENSNNEYVVDSLTSPGYYCNEEGTSSAFHPSPIPNSPGTYLSVN